MSLETDLQEPIQQEPPFVEEPAPPVDEEAALDAALEEQAIDVPDGDKLVPLSAVTTVRAKYKTAKQEAREAKIAADQAVEEARLTRQALEEAKPWIEAAKSLAAAKQMGIVPDQQHPPQADPQEAVELEAIAKDYDLYQGDGTPDLSRAKRILDRDRRIASEAAQQHIAPMQQQTVEQQSQANLQRALATTKLPDGREVQVDPGVLRDIWKRLDPALTGTKEGAKWAYMTAYGASMLSAPQKAAPKPAQGEPPPPPMFTERAGGRDTPGNVVLDDRDKKIAKDYGMTEKEYAEMAGKMPWRRG